MRVVLSSLLALILAACTSTPLAPIASTPSVDLVQLQGRDLGWGGIFLDRTRADVEAALGHPLPVEPNPEALVCGGFHSLAILFGRRVEIQWSSPEPTGTVESLLINLTAQEQTTPVARLVRRLRSRLPELVEPNPPGRAGYAAYLIPRNHPAHAIMLKSVTENFIYVSLEACFD